MSAVGRKADVIRQKAAAGGACFGGNSNRDTAADGAILPQIRQRCTLREIAGNAVRIRENAVRDNDIVTWREVRR